MPSCYMPHNQQIRYALPPKKSQPLFDYEQVVFGSGQALLSP